MRNYLLYSSSAHFLFLLGLFIFMQRIPLVAKKEQAYFIDFIGDSKIASMQAAVKTEPVPQPAAAKTTAERPDEDDFSADALPKPSVLSGEPNAQKTPAPAPAEARNVTGLVTDSQNFPYPWYIAQVREALWNAWTGKMPSGGKLRSTVKFTIKRNGDIKSVAVEKSSGNRLFDYASESSVQSASPFPPLPDDFYEDTLTVHVEFKAGE